MPTPNIEEILLQRIKDIRSQIETGGMSEHELYSAQNDLRKYIGQIELIKDKLSDIDGVNKLILDTDVKLNDELLKTLALNEKNDKALSAVLRSMSDIERQQKKIDNGRKESFNRYVKGIDTISSGIKQIGSGINSLIEPWAKIDQAAAN